MPSRILLLPDISSRLSYLATTVLSLQVNLLELLPRVRLPTTPIPCPLKTLPSLRPPPKSRLGVMHPLGVIILLVLRVYYRSTTKSFELYFPIFSKMSMVLSQSPLSPSTKPKSPASFKHSERRRHQRRRPNVWKPPTKLLSRILLLVISRQTVPGSARSVPIVTRISRPSTVSHASLKFARLVNMEHYV